MLHDRSVPMGGARIVVYGGALLFVGSLLLFLVQYFLSDRFGDDAGAWPVTGAWRPVLVDVALFSGFALHHSLFARTGLKDWIGRIVSPRLERSTYVWVASLTFAFVLLAWQPVPGTLWTTSGLAALVCTGVQIGGILLSVIGAGRIGGLTLAGVTEANGGARISPELSRSGLYAFVRHPIYLGWVLMVWPTPVMTGTRCVFAAISTAYLLVAIPFEERDLHRSFGPAYGEYARRVRWRMVPWLY
jgi:protein-S-isoprenylcysteine O-methyltransferase Ste14